LHDEQDREKARDEQLEAETYQPVFDARFSWRSIKQRPKRKGPILVTVTLVGIIILAACAVCAVRFLSPFAFACSRDNRGEETCFVFFRQPLPPACPPDCHAADLSQANLSGVELNKADLSAAILRRAELREARLIKADLSGADLSRADLRRASLLDANLSEARLKRADLTRADLRIANLEKADLSLADLFEADLSATNLRWANLVRADLTGADLREASSSRRICARPI